MNPEMMEALDALAESRGISKDALFAALAAPDATMTQQEPPR